MSRYEGGPRPPPSSFRLHSSSAASLLVPMDGPMPRRKNSTESQMSVSEKYSLSADPAQWRVNLSLNEREPDDHLHTPERRQDYKVDSDRNIFTGRGLLNIGCLIILISGMLALFAGYPIASYISKERNNQGNLGLGVNATGQIPVMGNFGLIDNDTPEEAYTRRALYKDEDWQLVFSDEFNQEGRTFYPGDDPFWEAVDLHYWVTNNMEWYDPAQITTKNGSLEMTLQQTPTSVKMPYQGGMMTTWNKFCFTGGMVVASAVLPGANNIAGLWPAIWTMGNLGRAGYGATLEGTWPYTYDECDVGTVDNQTVNGLPIAATENGDEGKGGVLSYLPGQRLSRCTCPGESHPGPMHSDGTYVGRSAPEIDIIEAQVVLTDTDSWGEVSQSGQWGPFNAEYNWFNESNMVIYDEENTKLNTYKGGVYQQATSGVSHTNQGCYQLEEGCYSVYGFEYKPGFDDAYIHWINDDKSAWTLLSAGMAADPRVEIGPRPVPQEPLYILLNLGMSENFGFVDVDHITFPAVFKIDWVRVYQPPNAINLGCDPPDFPTQAYINEYIEAYTNPNLTTWVDDYKQTIPKNSFLGEC